MAVIQTETGECVCCGSSTRSEVQCVCHAFNDWHANDNCDLKCGYHKADLYLKPERTVIAMGVPALVSTDRFRNYR